MLRSLVAWSAPIARCSQAWTRRPRQIISINEIPFSVRKHSSCAARVSRGGERVSRGMPAHSDQTRYRSMGLPGLHD